MGLKTKTPWIFHGVSMYQESKRYLLHPSKIQRHLQ